LPAANPPGAVTPASITVAPPEVFETETPYSWGLSSNFWAFCQANWLTLNIAMISPEIGIHDLSSNIKANLSPDQSIACLAAGLKRKLCFHLTIKRVLFPYIHMLY
jgi:hypothetical protein